MKRLKKKDMARYRKGSTNEARNCKWCRNFVRDVADHGNGVRSMAEYGRCKIMGLDVDRKYRIREDFTCDAQVTTYRNPYGK